MDGRAEPRGQAPVAQAEATDAQLLARMAQAAENPAGARAAWEAFYCRHVKYLYGVCLRAYGPLLGGEAGAADITAETFKRAYEFAHRFDAGGIDDDDRRRWRVRGWLGKIAQRLAQSALRGKPRLLEMEHWQQVSGRAAPTPGDPAKIERVRAALESLSQKEQVVLRTTLQFYRPESEHQRLPNDVATDLAAALKTTPENLRQIRRRALLKLAAILETQEDEAMGAKAPRGAVKT